MTLYATEPDAFRRFRPSREESLKAIAVLLGLTALLSASLVGALEVLSKPFLDKNTFFLSSAGFRIQLANDPAMKKAMLALPPHRFVVHRIANDVRYLYAEPQHCVCIFIGNQGAYQSYRDMLSQPPGSGDTVDADYRKRAIALLEVNPQDFNELPDTTAVGEILQLHY